MRLPRAFFLKPTLEVAERLLGKFLVHESPLGKIEGEINEVESYIGLDDLASHAAKGKTLRNEKMFGIGGFTYIYFIYGMYYCFNIVTEKEHFPAAILIRSVIPKKGIELMAKNRKKYDLFKIVSKPTFNLEKLDNHPSKITTDVKNLTNGPGKLCLAYGLDKKQNGIDLVTSKNLYLEDRGKKVTNFYRSPRVGIKVGLDKLWRFYY